MQELTTILLCLCLLTACDNTPTAMPTPIPNQDSGKLVFDPVELDMGNIMEGEEAVATLLIRNNGGDFSQIVTLESSCGCTTLEPETRMLAAGAFTLLHVKVDTFGKLGEIRKSITMTDQHGVKSTAWLRMHVQENPHGMDDQRSIFDGKCAACHVAPAKGKVTGLEIYTAVCVMCHGEAAKGGYAPSLHHFDDVDVLSALIANGTGTHRMPGFAQKKGGPLGDKQVDTLSKWIISLDE
ncbi:MAG: DUF1573 domain-containing protein [Mariprofundaceae bacterium]|nr:DUF1573 domain-containing protein [Mariprofundaceae bacterium]